MPRSQSDPEKIPDMTLPDPPHDYVSTLACSNGTSLLAAGSWDKTVRVWSVMQRDCQYAYTHDGPVLCACWTADGKQLFSGGMDGVGLLSDARTGQVLQSTRHETAIQTANWLEINGLHALLTMEWDKTMKFWDLRTPVPTRLSPLKSTTTVVSCFTKGPVVGYAVGAMDGRTAICSNDFVFRCHSEDKRSDSGGLPVAHAVNDISFHPINGTLATCGSDGTIKLWDKNRRKRLKTLEIYEGPVSRCSFNPDSMVLAYATNRRLSIGSTLAHPNFCTVPSCP
ncbi:WD40-repeat-containing domain protein [Armillaria luteobubalina]|uniref:WD40-repeat-containing domain protein n=1 Tax=Armillaria luteobubalina TaxID=153913 RepID=A0AA39QFP0_9AGAR|nr:WD40-repeat-containing domain protein [Armillaria luteobubalina]